MRKQTCILTSEAKTREEKNARKDIIDAVLIMFFDTESEAVKIITLHELHRQMEELTTIKTRAKWEDDRLRKMDCVWKYMLARDIDVIIVDDQTEVPE